MLPPLELLDHSDDLFEDTSFGLEEELEIFEPEYFQNDEELTVEERISENKDLDNIEE